MKGKPRKPKQYRNDGHSFELKLAVLKAVEATTMKETIARFFPALSPAKAQSKRRTIERWRHQRTKIERMAQNQRTKDKQRERHAGIATCLSADSETLIVRWINDLRKDGVPISSTMLRLKAVDTAEAEGTEGFLGRWSWRRGFLQRHKMVIRARIRQGQVTTGDAVSAVNDFSKHVLDTMARLGVSKVFNADQTAVFFEYLPKHTICKQGIKTVWVRCAGKEKERLTAMLLGDSDGNKYCPFVVVKTTRPKTAEQQVENDSQRHGFGRRLWGQVLQTPAAAHLQIYANLKGWWNESLSLAFLKHHFGGRGDADPPVVLIWDDMSAHWTAAVREYAASKRVELLRVPPQFTFCCQPADVAWNKPLKDRLRAKWIEQLHTRIRNNEKGAAPNRADVMSWIVDAWGGLSSRTIISGFRKCKLMPPTVEEDDEAESDCDDVVADECLIEAISMLHIVERRRVREEDDVQASMDDGDDAVEDLLDRSKDEDAARAVHCEEDENDM